MQVEGNLYNMSLVTSDNGKMFADSGDSGGAVYQAGSAGNYLVGILSGKIGADDQIGLVVDVIAVRNNYGINLYTTNTITPINN